MQAHSIRRPVELHGAARPVRAAAKQTEGFRFPTASRKTPSANFALLAVIVAAAIAALPLCGCARIDVPQTHNPSFAHPVADASRQGGPADRPMAEEPPDGEGDALSARAREIASSMTLEEKAAQMFIVKPEDITGVDVATQAGEATRAALARYPVGGLVYFAANLQNADQTASMLANTQEYAREISGLPPFLCVDEEGGTVSRVGGNPGFAIENVGDMAGIGATGDAQAAREAAKKIGEYLADLGFNVNFAPDADIANNPNSDVMALRSFGATADAVAPMVAAQVEGFSEAGVLCAAKHFPGIGGAEGDSHDASIYSNKTFDEMEAEELKPFEAAIEAGVPFVMVGHLSAPAATGSDRPASLSSAVVTGLLRDRLGYTGLIVTDALGMGAVSQLAAPADIGVEAIEAGVDLVLMPADFPAAYQGVLDAVASGRLTEARLDESVERIVRAKLSLDEA